MAWKLKYRCKVCGYEAEVYDGRGLFRQQKTMVSTNRPAMSCPNCKTIQNIVVGGIIADVAPSFRCVVLALASVPRTERAVYAYNVAAITSGLGI